MQDLVVITDPGKALDDEEMLVLLSRLSRDGLVKPRAVISNLAPQRLRARLAAGTLAQLGLTDVPVGAGSAVVSLPVQPDAELEAVSYLADDAGIQNGKELLAKTLEAATPGSITLLLVSAMSDAAALLHEHEELVKSRVGQVVIMGGVVHVGDEIALDADGFMTPDSAVNNHYDAMAARFLYRKLQELCVPMVVLTRFATYSSKVPRSLYERMTATGHPVGVRLGAAWERFISDFWRAVNSPPGDLAHDGLPARWKPELFLKTFCDGQGQDRKATDSITDLVKHAVLADPMALLAAVPSLRQRFFSPHTVTVRGTAHQLIGISQATPGVVDRDALVEYLSSTLIETLSRAPQALVVAPAPPVVLV